MTFIKSPCSTSSRITFVDVVGDPTKLVVFSKRKGPGNWRVFTSDLSRGERGLGIYVMEEGKPTEKTAQDLWDTLLRTSE